MTTKARKVRKATKAIECWAPILPDGSLYMNDIYLARKKPKDMKSSWSGTKLDAIRVRITPVARVKGRAKR